MKKFLVLIVFAFLFGCSTEDPNEDNDPIGSCIVSGQCVDRVQKSNCTSGGGIFSRSVCSTGSDPTGSCIVSGQCVDNVQKSNCTNGGGIFSSNACSTGSDPTGSCTVSGQCADNIKQSLCTSAGGTFSTSACPLEPDYDEMFCYNSDGMEDCDGIPCDVTEIECRAIPHAQVVSLQWCVANNKDVYACGNSIVTGSCTMYGDCYNGISQDDCSDYGGIFSTNLCSVDPDYDADEVFCYNSDGLEDCDGIPCDVTESECRSISYARVVSRQWCANNDKFIYDCY